MQKRQNQEKEHHQKTSDCGLEIVVIQGTVDVGFSVKVGTSQLPINHREGQVYNKIEQRVQPMDEMHWDRA